jgi:hypothetical protein
MTRAQVIDMADKSPRKQNRSKKVSTKEKQAKKKAKCDADRNPNAPVTGGPKTSA